MEVKSGDVDVGEIIFVEDAVLGTLAAATTGSGAMEPIATVVTGVIAGFAVTAVTAVATAPAVAIPVVFMDSFARESVPFTITFSGIAGKAFLVIGGLNRSLFLALRDSKSLFPVVQLIFWSAIFVLFLIIVCSFKCFLNLVTPFIKDFFEL